jgi:hypothetical protein
LQFFPFIFNSLIKQLYKIFILYYNYQVHYNKIYYIHFIFYISISIPILLPLFYYLNHFYYQLISSFFYSDISNLSLSTNILPPQMNSLLLNQIQLLLHHYFYNTPPKKNDISIGQMYPKYPLKIIYLSFCIYILLTMLPLYYLPAH